MNQDILSGKWEQMRGQVKQWWGRSSPTTTSIGSTGVETRRRTARETAGSAI
jgi:hypothetical protein